MLWELRYTLLAILITVGLLLPVPDAAQSEYAGAVLSVLGIGALGVHRLPQHHRLQPVVEARTLWGGIIINSRTLNNGLTSHRLRSPEVAAIIDRMRRRQVRYCWQLAAETAAHPHRCRASIELTRRTPPTPTRWICSTGRPPTSRDWSPSEGISTPRPGYC